MNANTTHQPVTRSSDLQIHRYSDLQIDRTGDLPSHRFSDPHIHQTSDLQIHRSSNHIFAPPCNILYICYKLLFCCTHPGRSSSSIGPFLGGRGEKQNGRGGGAFWNVTVGVCVWGGGGGSSSFYSDFPKCSLWSFQCLVCRSVIPLWQCISRRLLCFIARWSCFIVLFR